jgi:hypothetical protein
MTNKLFSERLNKELDSIDFPENHEQRIEALSKLIKVHRFTADSLLRGSSRPDKTILNLLAEEFEVNPDWLLRESEERLKKNGD